MAFIKEKQFYHLFLFVLFLAMLLASGKALYAQQKPIEDLDSLKVQIKI